MNIYPEVSYKTNYIDIAFSQPQTQMKDTELIELSILYSFDIKKSSNLLLKWSNCPYCHGLVVQYILPELSDRLSYLPYTLHTDHFLLLSQPSYHILLAVKKKDLLMINSNSYIASLKIFKKIFHLSSLSSFHTKAF